MECREVDPRHTFVAVGFHNVNHTIERHFGRHRFGLEFDFATLNYHALSIAKDILECKRIMRTSGASD